MILVWREKKTEEAPWTMKEGRGIARTSKLSQRHTALSCILVFFKTL